MRRHMQQPHHGHGCGCHTCRTQPIVCPPTYRFHDTFTQREVPFVHPIVNVNRQNVVNVPRHYFTESETTVPGRNIYADSCGPGFGGPGFGGPGFGGPGPFRRGRY
ncbi:hypothetical protein M3557_03410 [Bhargavaea ginsengi]|uniref:hypothetical protein n=1 Tax=Bhargavaea ginsengi TaxID=426757 RepID=UPI00203FF1EE|nr:hypothetical protein [Bhargavaea ginsengi]MCM3086954.1 hypothetical protein [Bhargavaea ginsengi]